MSPTNVCSADSDKTLTQPDHVRNSPLTTLYMAKYFFILRNCFLLKSILLGIKVFFYAEKYVLKFKVHVGTNQPPYVSLLFLNHR